MSKSKTVKASVEAGGLLRNLKNTFTGSTTFVGEALQNSRRAGATRIDITASDIDDGKGAVLVFQDDGKGVSDFQDLLSLGLSGWDDSVIEADQPFGMGFFSILLSADKVTVESGKSKMEVNGADICSMSDIAVSSLPDEVVGTRITMEFGSKGCDLLFSGYEFRRTDCPSRAFESAARAFPVPVFFNGAELDRDLSEAALSDGLLFENEYGRAYRCSSGWGSCEKICIQGLPIGVKGTSGSDLANRIVYHLNSDKFSVRMPDRDYVLDSKENRENVTALRNEAEKAYLRELAANERWDALWDLHRNVTRLGMGELFNACDWVPSRFLLPASTDEFTSGAAFNASDWEYGLDSSVSKTELGDSPVVDADGYDVGFDSRVTDMFNRPYLEAANAYILRCTLDENHWAMKNMVDELNAFVVEVTPNVEGESASIVVPDSVFGWSTELRSCKSLTLKGGLGEFEYTGNAVFDKGHLYVPDDVSWLCVLSLTKGDYYDEWGALQNEVHLKLAEDTLNATLESLRKDPLEIMQQAIEKQWKQLASGKLVGDFTVSITDDGVTFKQAA